MNAETAIHDSIEQAAEGVGSVWPLHSFVTANPLDGFEDQPFHEAVDRAADLLGADGYPDPDTFRQAWAAGAIDPDVLADALAEHGYDADPETSLDRLAADAEADGPTGESGADADGETATDRVDAVLSKWLAAFVDQGRTDWEMPAREDGFYAAFRAVAPHDGDVPEVDAPLPEDPETAIETVLDDHPVDDWAAIFEHHLAALPGWTGLVKQRAADGDAWQQAHPITLREYLAVRLALVDRFDAPVARDDLDTVDGDGSDDVPLEAVWLSAWEASYRGDLVDAVADESQAVAEETHTADDSDGRPAAQFVFCIDTRSEIIRRHVEAAGDYETHGYAGFFGVPMRYDGYDDDVTVDACPPILDAAHHVADEPTAADADTRRAYDDRARAVDAGRSLLAGLKKNAATAFSFVESAGAGYGLALAARTLLPARVHDAVDAVADRHPDRHEFCDPQLDHDPDADTALPAGLTLEQRVEYAATAFELMGWEQFARVVVLAGHASETTNNPFASSLDCGACAGNPGGPSARVLAAICNDDAVRAELEDRGIDVPDDTVFVAGEHNTTTDEIELYADDVPESHVDDVAAIRADLETAREGAAAERASDMDATASTGIGETERRASDWAETRPEWGLAGNAGFVVGPRELTSDLDLDGRAFLHSYDWTTDPDGDALEAIMTGPMVVTQWINNQYYFATVDNAVHGSGSKTTQNPVGNVGVYQGNGGDIMTGLPEQSLMAADDTPYHQPLRLSTVVHAPVDRVTAVLADNDHLTTLLDNDWLALTVVDPTQDHTPYHYDDALTWTPLHADQETARVAPTPTAAVDD